MCKIVFWRRNTFLNKIILTQSQINCLHWNWLLSHKTSCLETSYHSSHRPKSTYCIYCLYEQLLNFIIKSLLIGGEKWIAEFSCVFWDSFNFSMCFPVVGSLKLKCNVIFCSQLYCSFYSKKNIRWIISDFYLQNNVPPFKGSSVTI